MKPFWNPQRVEDRAKSMRSEAEADKRIADMRIQYAVMLEDIANAWEKDQKANTGTETNTDVNPRQPWLLWGNKVKCPYCGHVQDIKTEVCKKCGNEVPT